MRITIGERRMIPIRFGIDMNAFIKSAIFHTLSTGNILPIISRIIKMV